MPAPATPLTATRLWNSDQSWNFEREFATQYGHPLRVRIRRNAYDDQSYGAVDGFDPVAVKWNQLHRLPIADLRCKAVVYVHKDLTASQKALFDEDAKTLLKTPIKVLMSALEAQAAFR